VTYFFKSYPQIHVERIVVYLKASVILYTCSNGGVSERLLY